MKLLITDLDNTLYDWVTFFSKSFAALVEAIQKKFDIPRDVLLREFKEIHQKYRNSEHPYAACELPSIMKLFSGRSRSEIAHILNPDIFHAFNSTRNRLLTLYPGVKETLFALRSRGIRIIGHTEAIAENAVFRLEKLEVIGFFDQLWAIDAQLDPHPSPVRGNSFHILPKDFLLLIPPTERKPNPQLLLDICRREKVNPTETVYVGDSIARDVQMAQAAGVVSVWAEYGTRYDSSNWELLVKVTHWTDDDVRREAELKSSAQHIKPDHTIQCFGQLLDLLKSS